MLWFTGVWFEIEDPEDWLGKTRPAVFVGNHQTELDVLFLGHLFPKYCSVTAKKSLKFVPFLGWFSRYTFSHTACHTSNHFQEMKTTSTDLSLVVAMSKTVFIERSSRTQAVAAFDAAAQQMHTERQSVYIFPEGTRSYYEHPDMLPFKKGAFHLAVQAQVPIVPVIAANYSNLLNMKRKIFRSGRIPVKVLEPVSTKSRTKDDVDGLLEEVRARMMSELKTLTAQAREEGEAVRESESSVKMNGPAKSTGVDVGLNAAA